MWYIYLLSNIQHIDLSIMVHIDSSCLHKSGIPVLIACEFKNMHVYIPILQIKTTPNLDQGAVKTTHFFVQKSLSGGFSVNVVSLLFSLFRPLLADMVVLLTYLQFYLKHLTQKWQKQFRHMATILLFWIGFTKWLYYLLFLLFFISMVIYFWSVITVRTNECSLFG